MLTVIVLRSPTMVVVSVNKVSLYGVFCPGCGFVGKIVCKSGFSGVVMCEA
jgi:hypothetical protein